MSFKQLDMRILGMRILHGWNLRHPAFAASAVIVVALLGCGKRPEAVTVRLLQCRFFPPDELRVARLLPDEFHRETGLNFEKVVGIPGETFDQPTFVRKLLSSPSDTPDVVEIDETWLGIFKDELTDVRPYLSDVVATTADAVKPSYQPEGKFLAVPYQNQVGALAYRIDLLRKYGYDHPPATWNELERMALHIQTQERKHGNRNFWGFAWAGAAEESLTCAALEWQIDEGGGSIIEPNGAISVNNVAAFRSWERAKHWIGWISPTSVREYRESDALAAFMSGRSAFVRMWAGEPGGSPARPSQSLRVITWGHKPATGEYAISAMPAGSVRRVGVLGGIALAISKRSKHPQEDASLIRFLLSKQTTAFSQKELPFPPPQAVLYYPASGEKTEAVAPNTGVMRPVIVTRPTNAAGPVYDQVSKSYFMAVHSVLTNEKTGHQAAQDLEKELIRETGLRPGPPTSN